MVLRKRTGNKHELPDVDSAAPVKQQVVVEAVRNPYDGAPEAKAVVVNQANGTVGFFDKVKNYYKGLIVLVGSVLTILTQISGLVGFIPGPVAGYVTTGIVILTTVLAFLKSNEVWVQKL